MNPAAARYPSACSRDEGLTDARITIHCLGDSARHRGEWDRLVTSSALGCVYQMAVWRDVIRSSYGHDAYYLLATESPPIERRYEPAASEAPGFVGDPGRAVGILPLIHMRHWLFGNSLVSLPYFDGGGILAAGVEAQSALVQKGLDLAQELGAGVLELRQLHALVACGQEAAAGRRAQGWRVAMDAAAGKARMVLDLPQSADLLMASFRAKLRNQIHKPVKAGLKVQIGGNELLDDFYRVFVENMRELGSPVHAKALMRNVLLRFPQAARIFVVYGDGTPVAASLAIGHKETLTNPWASSLRRYSKDAPNMLLYWAMLEFACQHGYRSFDFGRSTIGEGTYRFKEQWGAVPQPLRWVRFERQSASRGDRLTRGQGRGTAAACWSHLPLLATRVLGPRIRRHISL